MSIVCESCLGEDGRPTSLPVIAETIPPKLRIQNQFGVWRFEEFTDEETGEVWWDKIPINARTGRRASSTNPDTWSTFEQAVRAYERGGFDGLAFFLKPGGGLVGIDLDRCRDATTGAIEDWAQHIVDRLDTYCELSPSGRGLRLFLWGELPPRDRREGRFECYSSARFLTLTGWRIHPATVERRQAELTAIHTEIFAARVARRNAAPPVLVSGYRPHTLSDLEIIEKAGAARNGSKFRSLYHSGDTSGHRSHSEADLALCGQLAFYCGPDPARIDELFRGSGLFRAKWNRADYRDSTIALALQSRTQFYSPRRSLRRQRRHGHSTISFALEVS
jgi:putative DNA primase/helicase